MNKIQEVYADRGPLGALEYLYDEIEKLKAPKEQKTDVEPAWQVPTPVEEVKSA